ncbi:MAG: HD family hydrolase [Robiginitomaculum sp.]|nr:HD family hydrolase [Robiginitomaculum sp.]MDQ7078142.1 HD family hydrolase [Robiginitomaculum sp.]
MVTKSSISFTPPKRAWQRMLSGRRLDILDPSPLDIEIEDIAHGLARVARWNGQTRSAHAFSVAEHSLVVEQIARHLKPDLQTRWCLAALLHDAPEYVIGDMISPFKAALGSAYKAIEHKLEAAIHLRFSLPAALPVSIARLIKKADRLSAYFEAEQIAGFSASECHKYFLTPPPDLKVTIEPMPVAHAQIAFMERFEALNAALGKDHYG